MELRKVLALGKKWLWLIVLGVLIGGAVGLAVDLVLPKTYESDTTLYFSSPNHTDNNSLLGDQQAAKAFAGIPSSDVVLRATLQAVGDKSLSVTQFATMVVITNTLNTQYVTIGVRDSSPEQAVRLVQELTKQSIAHYEAAATDQGQTQQFVQQELDSLANEIKNLEQAVATAQNASAATPQATPVSQLSADLSADRALYNQLLGTYSQLGSTQINVVQEAQFPQKPVGLGKTLAMALGLLVGLMAVVSLIILLEQTDDILRSAEKVDQATGLSILVTVPYLPESARRVPLPAGHYEITDDGAGATMETSHMNGYHEVTEDVDTIQLPAAIVRQKRLQMGRRETGEGNTPEAIDTVPAVEEHGEKSIQDADKRLPAIVGQTVLTTAGRSLFHNAASNAHQLPEEFLTLGVLLSGENGLLAANGHSVGTLLITSPGSGDGKTQIASQVALGLARVGVKTILVDANVRKPEMQTIFGVSSRVGLSSLLTSKLKIDASLVFDILQETDESNLAILPGGPAIGSPSELLSSSRMKAILHLLSEQAMVVIDSPAVLSASDAVILARKCDGVLIVVDARRTSATKLNQALEILTRVNTNILGAVLNRASSKN